MLEIPPQIKMLYDELLVIPRKATNDTFSPAININSRVAQACNSQLQTYTY
jgi:hypothetical protein